MRLPDHPAAVRKTRHVKTRALAALPGLALLSFAALANAQTVTWDGSDSDNWSDPDNWDVGVPGAGDDIIVDADPGALIESGAFFGANLTVGALDYSVLEIVGASLSLTGDATIGDESFAGLYIEDGGTFSATNFTAGATPYGFGDILVSGAGSRLEASTIVIGGAGGGGGYLEVLDGAHVEADTLIFGVSYNSFAQAEFSGAGTIVSAANLVQIGVDTMGVWGGGAIITVADGASFVAPAGIELAHSPNSLGILVIAGDDPGIIDTPTITMGDGYPQIVFAHTSDHYIFTPDIVGSGADGYLWFADSGETVLTGQSGSFAGTIYIYNGARLIVDGALGGNFNVQTFLGGSGAVGNLLVYDFGVVSPGNSIGTLTANGNVTFEQDSFLEIEVNASGAGDLLVVTGDATLNGGQVRVLLENGAYAPSTTYRILEANSVNGAFDSVSPNFAFLDADLDYGADFVDLILTRNAVSFADIALTQNQRNTAGAIESFGPGAALYDALIGSSVEDAQRAYETLAGDIFAGIANLSAQEFLSFSDALNTRLVQTAEAARPFMLASNAARVSAPRNAGGEGAWVTALSSGGEVDSDGNYAELDADRTGFVLGLDRAIAPNAWVGAAFGVTDVDYDVRSVGASGESASYQAALYGGAQNGANRIRGGIAYAYRTIETQRIAEIGGATQRLSSDYESQGVQLFGEIGRSMEFSSALVEPFFNASLIQQWTGGFSETGGSAALSFDDADQTILSLVGGARGAFELSAYSFLYGTLAWRRAEGDIDQASQANFVSAPEQDFSLSGAPLEANTALLQAGFRRDFSSASFMLSYEGELGENTTRNGVRLHYRVAL